MMTVQVDAAQSHILIGAEYAPYAYRKLTKMYYTGWSICMYVCGTKLELMVYFQSFSSESPSMLPTSSYLELTICLYMVCQLHLKIMVWH